MMSARNQTTYIDAIRSFCSRYPDLVKFNRFLGEPEYFLGKAAVLQFGSSSNNSKVERFDFRDVNDLKAYLSGTARNACKHRLYLLEDLSRPFVEAFGAYFWMDPVLFAAHENSTHWTASRWDYALPRRLPSVQKSDPHFALRYYEVVKALGDEDWNGIRTVSNVHRKVELGDPDRYFQRYNSNSYVIRRNASFWSRVRKDGGWDGQ
jgi:hypothetical protein